MKKDIQTRIKRNIPYDYVSTFITYLNMQSSIWVLYLAYCGLSLAQIGLLEGIYHATSILCEIPSGALADLLGRKRSMILSRICVALSCVIMLFSKSFWLFALSFFIQALGNNFNSGSEEALIYDSMKFIGQEEKYMGVNGRLNVIIEISQGIATVAGGILAEYSYFWCYAACVVIAVLALIPVLLMTEVPIEKEEKKISVGKMVADHFKTSCIILKKDSRIVKVIIYYSMVFASETLLFFYSQKYYSDLGFNKIQISMFLLFVSICTCAGALLSDRIFTKIGNRLSFIGALAIALAFFGYGPKNVVLSVLSFAVAGFFCSALYPVQSYTLNRLIPSKQRATLISVSSMMFSVAMIVLFPIAGAFADYFGLAKVFIGIGAILAVFVIVWPRGKEI